MKSSKKLCKSGQVRDKSTKRCRKTKKRYGNAYSPSGEWRVNGGIKKSKRRGDGKYATLYAEAEERDEERHAAAAKELKNRYDNDK